MAFEKLPDNKGMIYVPDSIPRAQKHPCPDCFSCQWCSGERCRSCCSKNCPKEKGKCTNWVEPEKEQE